MNAQEKKLNNIDRTGYFGPGRTAMAISTNQNNLLSEPAVNSLAEKTEDLSKRDAFSKHYKNSNGTYTARISSVPINYQKDGKWNNIDTNITVDKTAKHFSYSNKTNLMETSFGSSSDKGVVTYSNDGTVKDFLDTTMYWEGKGKKLSEQKSKNVAPAVKGSKLFYNNLFGNISAEFTILAGERKLNYLVPNRKALGEIPAGADFLVFTEEVSLPKGWTYEISPKKDILLKNEKRQVIYSYLHPQVLENYVGGVGILEKDNPASFEIEQTSDGFTIKTKVKTAWLVAGDRVFPLAIDPTTKYYPNNDAYWSGWVNNNNTGGNPLVRVGYTSSAAIFGFIKFNTSAVPTGATINSVKTGLYLNSFSGNGISRGIYIGNSSDPVISSSAQIYSSLTTALSNGVYVAGGYTVNTFSAAGINYVQNNLINGFTAVTVVPANQTGWTYSEYFQFNGFSNDNTYGPYLEITYTDATISYCAASVSSSSQSSGTHIKKVSFQGTLNDVTNTQTNPYKTTATYGYQDYTGLAAKTKQAMGSGINVYVETNSIIVNNVETNDAYYKAWVDWNKDGDFVDDGEQVYYSNAYVVSTTFGIIVPPTLAKGPGDYRLRIRVNKKRSGLNDNTVSCGVIDNAGETEDYLISVIDSCPAVVTSVGNATRCGNGTVTLTATASAGGITEFRWYTQEEGGTYVTSPVTNGKTTSWTTPSLSNTTTYYVEAYNGTCKSQVRIAVRANIQLVPNIKFTPEIAESCGTNSVVTISAVGGNEMVYLIEENFEGTGLGKFKTVRTGVESTFPSNADKTIRYERAKWQTLASVNTPIDYRENTTLKSSQTWFPAISSGINGNKFAMASSDIGSYGGISLVAENSLESVLSVPTIDFVNLTLSFEMYYSRYHQLGVFNDKDYVAIEVATNAAGTNWEALPNNAGMIVRDVGFGTNFEKLTFDLSNYINKPNLKVRIRYHGEWCDGVAVDDIMLFGEKKLKPTFTWDPGTNPLNFYANPDGTGLITTGIIVATAVYVKPTLDQMESANSWSIIATATLGNGCPVSGSVALTNKNKVWNDASETSWHAGAWKPTNVLPDLTTCVIVRKPLELRTANGLAKTIEIVELGTGSLNIKAGFSLTLEDEIINKRTGKAEDYLILENDANLLQNNNNAVNIGPATLKRNSFMKRQDYTYWGSPVHNQNLKAFSPSTLDTRFSIYNETTDLFVPIDPLTTNFIPGKGYAIRAPNTFPRDNVTYATFVGNFVGVLNNGTKYNGVAPTEFPLSNTANGYNLIANPYPSNIDFGLLVSQNATQIKHLAYFWTNINKNPRMQSSGYPLTGWVNNYATLNGTMGTPASYVKDTYNQNQPNILQSKTPNNLIKPGQGFIVQAATTTTGKLSFNNYIRTANATNSNFFNNKMTSKKSSVDRFWIQMTTPMELVTTAGIGYVSGATNDFEIDYDAPMMGLGSDAIYTILGTEQLGIQGREYPLIRSDVVDLGTNHFEDGIYTIAIPLAEGIFNGSQAIYLKDNETGIVTNLSENRYSYAAVKGQSDGRFELFYEAKTVLGTDSLVKETLIVYREGNSFVVKSPTKKITDLEMFDSSGRLIYKVGPNNTKTIVPAESITQGVYILKINQEGEITTRKVMK